MGMQAFEPWPRMSEEAESELEQMQIALIAQHLYDCLCIKRGVIVRDIKDAVGAEPAMCMRLASVAVRSLDEGNRLHAIDDTASGLYEHLLHGQLHAPPGPAVLAKLRTEVCVAVTRYHSTLAEAR